MVLGVGGGILFGAYHARTVAALKVENVQLAQEVEAQKHKVRQTSAAGIQSRVYQQDRDRLSARVQDLQKDIVRLQTQLRAERPDAVDGLVQAEYVQRVVGMTADELTAFAGPPTRKFGEQGSIWYYEEHNVINPQTAQLYGLIQITFEDGRVAQVVCRLSGPQGGPAVSILSPRAPESCRYDILSLGEVMLRLDPGEGRIRTARAFRVWEGGGEYNVARGLRRCFGLRAAVVTALADNEVGRLLEDLNLQGGVSTEHIQWRPYDGVGRSLRNGLNFTERGFGVRGAVGCSDRGHTALAQLRVGEVDWEHLFGVQGVRWLHTGGICAALSEHMPALMEEAMQVARAHGTLVSYDLNYRPSLWQAVGGRERAREVNRRLVPLVDVLLGNEEDFTACLGFEVEGVDAQLTRLDPSKFKAMIAQVVRASPRLRVVATTLRGVRTATVNDWGAVCWAGGTYHEARPRPGLEILDRVGGGDSFASGLVYGLLVLGDPARAVEYGAAHGALAMTTPGDTSMATLAEVEQLAGGGSARVQR